MRIAYQQPNGIVAIISSAPEATKEEIYARSIPKDAINVHELPDDWKVPDVDRRYRNAWVTNGSKVSVDVVKACDIETKIQISKLGTVDPKVSLATTVEELRLAIPNVLKENSLG